MFAENLLRAFAVLWTFALGASVGSFLNVVVYRLPAGLALSHPPSRCPRCGTPIRTRDNLPVLGWLLLRGRCRDCGLPIAARYPLVEAACGLLAVSLAVPEVLAGGVNLPVPVRRPAWGPLARHYDPDLIAVCVSHAAAGVLLVGAALFARDGRRVPGRVWVAAAVLAVLPPAVWPGLRLDPLPFGPAASTPWDLTWGTPPRLSAWGLPFTVSWRGPADAAVAAVLGIVAAFPASRLLPRSAGRGSFVFAGAASAAFFAPAVAACGVGAGLLAWVSVAWAAGRRWCSPTTAAAVATLTAVLGWRAWAGWTDDRPWLPVAVLLAGWSAAGVVRALGGGSGQAAADSGSADSTADGAG